MISYRLTMMKLIAKYNATAGLYCVQNFNGNVIHSIFENTYARLLAYDS